MSRIKLRFLYVGLAALLLAILWMLAWWVPGDRAAFFGALTLFIVPLLGWAACLDHLLTGDTLAAELSGAELDRYLLRKYAPRWLPKGQAYVFGQTFLIGLWIGSTAQHPGLMAACALLAGIAMGGAIGATARFRLPGTVRLLSILYAAVAIGMAFRLLLH